jgi:hypothetical protein
MFFSRRHAKRGVEQGGTDIAYRLAGVPCELLQAQLHVAAEMQCRGPDVFGDMQMAGACGLERHWRILTCFWECEAKWGLASSNHRA